MQLKAITYTKRIIIIYTNYNTIVVFLPIMLQSVYYCIGSLYVVVLPHRQIKYPVDFDDELKIGDVRYDDMT